MQWTSAISEQESLKNAIRETTRKVKDGLGGQTPDLLLAFVSNAHQAQYGRVPSYISDTLPVDNLIGCSGGGVIGDGREVEDRPAVSITGAVLPDVSIDLFHLEDKDLPTPDDGPSAWEEILGVKAEDTPHFVVLPDPFTIHADSLVQGLDFAFARGVKIGGLASGGMSAGANALFLGSEVHRSGAVGLALSGNLKVETIVAQGCRPIGESGVITRCNGNLLMELDGRSPLEALRTVFDQSDDHDRRLINSALHLGVVMDPLKDQFSSGDFLIRNVMGLHQESGALVVGEMLSEGQVVQFHVRDAETARHDLEAVMDRYVEDTDSPRASGALLFSCLGRGERLFGRPNHDSDIFLDRISRAPLSGFFCNGEIGQVGGSTFLHGFTSSFAMFSPTAPTPANETTPDTAISERSC